MSESNSIGYKTNRKKIYKGIFNIIKCFKSKFIKSQMKFHKITWRTPDLVGLKMGKKPYYIVK